VDGNVCSVLWCATRNHLAGRRAGPIPGTAPEGSLARGENLDNAVTWRRASSAYVGFTRGIHMSDQINPEVVVPQRAVVTIPPVSGIARDSIQIGFHFDNPSLSVDSNIKAFFNTVATGGLVAVNGYMSPTLSHVTNSARIQYYDLTAALGGSGTLGPPISTTFFALGGGGGTPLPSELALALSYHAEYTTIPEHGPGARPRARYRGRIYLGPLTTAAMAQDSTTHRSIVSPGASQSIVASAKALLLAEPSWSVWSRKDRVLRRVVGGWLDDAFDIQRRRGEDPVARVNFP
jgi:hypothetical protein